MNITFIIFGGIFILLIIIATILSIRYKREEEYKTKRDVCIFCGASMKKGDHKEQCPNYNGNVTKWCANHNIRVADMQLKINAYTKEGLLHTYKKNKDAIKEIKALDIKDNNFSTKAETIVTRFPE